MFSNVNVQVFKERKIDFSWDKQDRNQKSLLLVNLLVIVHDACIFIPWEPEFNYDYFVRVGT